MVIAVGAATFADALDMTAEVYRAAGAILAGRGKLRGLPTRADIGRPSTPTRKRSG